MMKILFILCLGLLGILTACVVCAGIEAEDNHADYDDDNDGGFFDDWRLP